MRRIFWLLLFLPLANAFAFGGKRADPAELRPLLVADDLPDWQQRRLAKDWKFFRSLQLAEDSEELAGLFGQKLPNQSSFEGWLTDRVQYIVSANFRQTEEMEELEDFAYENSDAWPEELRAFVSSVRSAPAVWQQSAVAMQNLGTGVYIEGKMRGRLMGLRIAGFGLVPIPSPRTGVLMMGEGFFERRKGESIDAPSAVLERLGVLFHEARHSDGNGESLGFPHVSCPRSHDYAGLPACDFSLNGAYAIGAASLRRMLDGCQGCSVKDQERLRLAILDSHQRVISQKHDHQLLTDTLRCRNVERLGFWPSEEIKERCSALRGTEVKEQKALHRNPLPEGRR